MTRSISYNKVSCNSLQKNYIQYSIISTAWGGFFMKTYLNIESRFLAMVVALLFVAGCGATVGDYREILRRADRIAGELELDQARKPHEVLAFYGVKSGDKVADLWAGRGYYTSILSEVVGAGGLVYTQNPNSRDEINQRWKAPKFANVRVADGPFDKLPLPQNGALDLVLIHLNYHDVDPAMRGAMNKAILGSLKRGGTYAIVDHSAKDGTGNEANKTLHRIDKAQVIKEVAASGFTLGKEGDMLRIPSDPRDFNVNKERNKDDRFVLAFQKP
jgi:predicted methyltransferase